LCFGGSGQVGQSDNGDGIIRKNEAAKRGQAETRTLSVASFGLTAMVIVLDLSTGICKKQTSNGES
jgi:hypothetical protein